MQDKKYIMDKKRRVKMKKFVIIVSMFISLLFLTACGESYDLKELETTLTQKDWEVLLFEDIEDIELQVAFFESIEELPVLILFAIYGDEMDITLGDFHIGFIYEFENSSHARKYYDLISEEDGDFLLSGKFVFASNDEKFFIDLNIER
jgi:hypothetical protein